MSKQGKQRRVVSKWYYAPKDTGIERHAAETRFADDMKGLGLTVAGDIIIEVQSLLWDGNAVGIRASAFIERGDV